jgi:hypothetical protein
MVSMAPSIQVVITESPSVAVGRKVRNLAKAYGIEVLDVGKGQIPKEFRLPNTRLGVGCDPKFRRVYVDFETQLGELGQPSVADRHELLFHEICHVIVQPPRMDIRVVPELAILIPFEHALGMQELPELMPGNGILSFQAGTDIRIRGRGRQYFWEFKDMGYDHPCFTAGVRMCERLGLLEASGRPIVGQYPNWGDKRVWAAFRRRVKTCMPKKRRKYQAAEYGLAALKGHLTEDRF